MLQRHKKQEKCFKDLDVNKYEIVATLDNHTSEICQELDGKVFDMKDYQVGATAPPFHPNCRTVTVPWFPDDVGERAARGKDGKTYYVPADMNYKEWKEKYVEVDEKGLTTMENWALMQYKSSKSYKINNKLRENLELS